MPDNPNILSKFWQELKRRNVVRVITVYAASAFVVLELVDILAPSLGLPAWTLNLVLILLIVGFIIAIILSWIYDIHPEGGMVKTEPVDKVKAEDIPKSSNSWKIASYISFVVIVALITINIFGLRGRVKIDESLAKSIAVLPFHNYSGDPGQDFMCQGLTDEIISHLFKVRSFDEVRSLTSVLPFKDSEQNIKEIARELQVNYILEGSYKRMGDELKITAQLIEPGSDNHIWLQDYELPYSEVPGIPGEIALQIANHIKTFISEDEQKRINRTPTSNQEAYELVQQVSYYFIRRDISTLPYEKALFKAIELDPEYADAYAWLGFVALMRVSYRQDTSSTSQLTVYDALPYVNKALEIDPDNAWAYYVLSNYNIWVKWDYAEAERYLLKATNLEPNNILLSWSLAHFYLFTERYEELELLLPALKKESEMHVEYYAKLRNYQAFQRSREIYYEFVGQSGLPPIGDHYIWLEEYDSARYCFEKAIELGNEEMATPRFRASLAISYQKTDDSVKAREIIKELQSNSDQAFPGSPEYFLGLYYSGIGEVDSAYYWLEKAYNRHSAELYWLRVNPVFDDIRDDPRYWDLYERTGHKAYDDYMASKQE